MKLFFKIIWFFLIYVFYFSSCFALDATIKVDNDDIDINDYINLKIEIDSSINADINIEKIAWIEDFEIIRQSQSQSSSMSSVNINWKIEVKNNYKYILNIILKAKSKGEFMIWPAIINSNNVSINTNSVNINVSWEKIQIWNNWPLNLPDYKEEVNNDNSEKIYESNKKSINDENNIENSSYNFWKINSKNDYEILILVIVLITFTLFTYKLLNKNT